MGAVLLNPDGKPSHQIVVDGEVVDGEDRAEADLPRWTDVLIDRQVLVSSVQAHRGVFGVCRDRQPAPALVSFQEADY